jgi:hypothetical protein
VKYLDPTSERFDNILLGGIEASKPTPTLRENARDEEIVPLHAFLEPMWLQRKVVSVTQCPVAQFKAARVDKVECAVDLLQALTLDKQQSASNLDLQKRRKNILQALDPCKHSRQRGR